MEKQRPSQFLPASLFPGPVLRLLYAFAVVGLVSWWPQSASGQTAPEDIAGSYQGSTSGTASNCTDPFDNGFIFTNVSVRLYQPTGVSSLTGLITVAYAAPNGQDLILNLSATVSAPGNSRTLTGGVLTVRSPSAYSGGGTFSGQWTRGNPDAFSFNYTVQGNAFLSNCTISGSVSQTRLGPPPPVTFSQGILSQPPGALDPQVQTTQQNGVFTIKPRAGTPDLHYNGFVSDQSIDLNDFNVGVEVKQTTTGGAETVFSIGEDSNTFFRFAKIDGNRTPGGFKEDDSLRSDDGDVAADASFLFFQIKVGGVPSSLNIPYDPVLHRFWRFRHQKEDNTINFETSPDQATWTNRHKVTLERGISELTAELSAGTSTTVTDPGSAIFGSFLLGDTFSIAGQVKNAGNVGLGGVLISLTGWTTSTVTTDGNGRYKFPLLDAGKNYTVAPSRVGYTFSSGSQTFNALGSDKTADFSGQLLWEPFMLTASQADIKTWTFQGRTYAYVKLQFPAAGYRVADWAQAVRSANDFSANAAVEKFNGASVQSVTTTAQIYDLGPLAAGNYTFTFKNSGTVVKSQAFTVTSSTPPANPIDNPREFVKQQYRDFLNREADPAGENFWTDNITKCSDPARRPPGQTEAQCTALQRASTSGAFFLSPELQYTGYFVYRMYQGALGRQPKLSEFIPDAQFVGAGIIVNNQLSGTKINQNKALFAELFVNCTDAAKFRCAEFKAIYNGLNDKAYVDKLFLTTGVNASTSERTALVDGLTGPATETRGSVLQKVVDGINVISEGNQQFTTTYGHAFYNAELNRAFVQLQYFGYLKRDPDEAGYAFWLSKLNQFGGDFANAQMVLAFISSPEYRARFGQP